MHFSLLLKTIEYYNFFFSVLKSEKIFVVRVLVEVFCHYFANFFNNRLKKEQMFKLISTTFKWGLLIIYSWIRLAVFIVVVLKPIIF